MLLYLFIYMVSFGYVSFLKLNFARRLISHTPAVAKCGLTKFTIIYKIPIQDILRNRKITKQERKNHSERKPLHVGSCTNDFFFCRCVSELKLILYNFVSHKLNIEKWIEFTLNSFQSIRGISILEFVCQLSLKHFTFP